VADIELNSRVANPFVRMDWNEEGHDPAGFRSELVRLYELGKVIILENAPFQINFALLNKISLPQGRTFQKLSDKFLCAPKLYRADVRRLLYDAFGIDVMLYLDFRREVGRLSASLRDFARDVFQTYRFLKLDVSWRFTPTGPEGLHVDYFKRVEDLHYLRIFLNVDHQPRVWTVSHQLEELIERYSKEARLLELIQAPSNAVCSRLNEVVFDHVNALPRSAMDRHTASFAPGEVWLCETRLNSHEIYSGHRLVATDFYVHPASMLDPSQRVEARVKRSLERLYALQNRPFRSRVSEGGEAGAGYF
jgi:3-deoxy-D-manno-oct-2-ulosonic acid (Kdo) hydroxylase